VSDETAKADCYAAGERGAMTWWQDWRAWFLGPLLRLMGGAGITPDHVTLASLLAGLAFCPLWLWPGNPLWARPAALAGLVLHVLLDGLDGPLARHLGIAGRRGSFTDTLADQIVVTVSTLTLMASADSSISVWIGGAYPFLYAAVVGFAMVRNALGNPYSWLVRPRFWVYGWIAVDLFLLPGWMNVVLALFAALLGLKMASGFIAIRRSL
jgi:phosphatidylglycerophosphate synthase